MIYTSVRKQSKVAQQSGHTKSARGMCVPSAAMPVGWWWWHGAAAGVRSVFWQNCSGDSRICGIRYKWTEYEFSRGESEVQSYIRSSWSCWIVIRVAGGVEPALVAGFIYLFIYFLPFSPSVHFPWFIKRIKISSLFLSFERKNKKKRRNPTASRRTEEGQKRERERRVDELAERSPPIRRPKGKWSAVTTSVEPCGGPNLLIVVLVSGLTVLRWFHEEYIIAASACFNHGCGGRRWI